MISCFSAAVLIWEYDTYSVGQIMHIDRIIYNIIGKENSKTESETEFYSADIAAETQGCMHH